MTLPSHTDEDKKTTYYWVCTFANNQHNPVRPRGLVPTVAKAIVAKANQTVKV